MIYVLNDRVNQQYIIMIVTALNAGITNYFFLIRDMKNIFKKYIAFVI